MKPTTNEMADWVEKHAHAETPGEEIDKATIVRFLRSAIDYTPEYVRRHRALLASVSEGRVAAFEAGFDLAAKAWEGGRTEFDAADDERRAVVRRMSARPYETRAAAMSYGIRCEKTGWFRVEQVRR